MLTLDELAKQLDALEKVDGTGFRRRARVLQSMWREEHGYDADKDNRPRKTGRMGSRLKMPWAKETLSNYLTDTIRGVVNDEVVDPEKSRGKLYKKPRIFNDLLSSQPLAFNLFGELQKDRNLCSKLISGMTNGRFQKAIDVEFEYSPGRGDEKYTGDHSALDVFIGCQNKKSRRAFIGIEVKYHENLKVAADDHKARYDQIAADMGCFSTEAKSRLKKSPLQQIWRDHLLACSMLRAKDFDEGLFVFLHPKDNTYCASAVKEYRACLSDDRTFAAWTLDDVVDELKQRSKAAWIRDFQRRYLDFARIDERLKKG